MWERKVQADARKAQREHQAMERERAARNKDQKISLALEETKEAELAVSEAQEILSAGLRTVPAVDWESMKDRSPFHDSKPSAPEKPVFREKPDPSLLPKKPDPSSPVYQAKHGLMSRLIPGRKEREILEATGRYHADVDAWKTAVREFNERVRTHNNQIDQLKEEYYRKAALFKQQMKAWESRRQHFEAEQAKQHQEIEQRKQNYLSLDPGAVLDFCETLLTNSVYPAFCPRSFDCDYIAETKALIIDHALPRIEDLPSRKASKYIQSQDIFTYTELSDSALSKLYEEVNYMIVLRTLHEIFSADEANAIDSIVFNGIVDTIDKATGQNIKPCIISIQVSRTEFQPINLHQVDAKACFRKLKGVSAAKLQALQPVAPVAQISREDSRFVESYDVAHTLDDSMNLASMDWEDFEHLIRELFGKEFGRDGGEVKVTQASRDGGVDAVAFDPDPIRGGKIVIQAKRYTNVVDASAVRDLWGTIQHEGAMKGILVTTSHYGADAYAWAKGKPITLLDGGHLLHLLARHGHKAKIDIGEARKELASGSKK